MMMLFSTSHQSIICFDGLIARMDEGTMRCWEWKNVEIEMTLQNSAQWSAGVGCLFGDGVACLYTYNFDHNQRNLDIKMHGNSVCSEKKFHYDTRGIRIYSSTDGN